MKGNKQIAQRFNEALRKRNLCDSDVAKKTGLSRNTIGNWRNGISSPSLDDFMKVCDVFNLDIVYILNRNERESILHDYLSLDEKFRTAIDVLLEGLIKSSNPND